MINLYSVKEEIAHNLLEQLDSIVESGNDELLEKWISSLTEEQIMILEEEEPWFDWKGMIPGMNTYRQYKQGNLGANWDTAKSLGFDALNAATLIPAIRGAKWAAQGLGTIAKNTASKLATKSKTPLATIPSSTSKVMSGATPAETLASKMLPSTLQSRAAIAPKPTTPVVPSVPPASFTKPSKLGTSVTAAGIGAEVARKSIAPSTPAPSTPAPMPNIPLNRPTQSQPAPAQAAPSAPAAQPKATAQTVKPMARPQQRANVPARKPVATPQRTQQQRPAAKPSPSRPSVSTGNSSRYGIWGGAMGTMNESFETFIRHKYNKRDLI